MKPNSFASVVGSLILLAAVVCCIAVLIALGIAVLALVTL